MKRAFLILAAALSLAGFALVPAHSALAASKDDVCAGVGIASGAGGNDCKPAEGATNVNTVISTGLRLFQVIVGLIAIIMMITAGLRFITSSGDPTKVASARNTILYAAVGIVVVAMSQVIIQFVLNRAT